MKRDMAWGFILLKRLPNIMGFKLMYNLKSAKEQFSVSYFRSNFCLQPVTKFCSPNRSALNLINMGLNLLRSG